MSKLCKCANPKCGHCIVEGQEKVEGQGKFIHITGGVKGLFGPICPICGCDFPKPNPNDDDCESFGA